MSNIEKNKVTSLETIVRMIGDKPYYEIKYKNLGEDYYHVGYSSFNIKNVLQWKEECFEFVESKETNADKIRNMSDYDLGDLLQSVSSGAGNGNPFISLCVDDNEITMDFSDIYDWLQSEAE